MKEIGNKAEDCLSFVWKMLGQGRGDHSGGVTGVVANAPVIFYPLGHHHHHHHNPHFHHYHHRHSNFSSSTSNMRVALGGMTPG